MKRSEHRIGDLHASRYEVPEAEYAFLIVHGMGGHGGIYEEFCEHHCAAAACEIWTFDLPGHGRSTGERGDWRIEDAIAGTLRMVEEVDRKSGKPVFLLGSSMGSSIGLYSLNESDRIRGAVFMGAAIPCLEPLRDAYAFLRAPAVEQLTGFFGNTLRLDLDRYLDFETVYGDPEVARAKKQDPLNAWLYGFKDYVDFLTFEPRVAPSGNRKPILVAVGEEDPLFGPEATKQVVDQIGGPVELHVQPRGVHQLMLFHTEAFSKLIDDWVLTQLRKGV
ncbi:MAG: alpha/beta fold hydrolase [Planctomycetota bacterium]|jgi:pimeloyl-ACP methyl ester carboxylesterase|nr:alpha/beta fold hydrolase [Deltaproteobacteria bacterium]